MNDIKKKNILIVIAILFIGLVIIGGTYAYLTFAANVTNGTYNVSVHCFNIDYTINNGDNTQDITGTLFPSSSPSSGLNGRVGLKLNASCSLPGTGTIKLHINNGTSTALTTPASSYCEDRSTLEPISGITTESACTTAGGRWQGYGDSYCESNATLERLTDYTDSSSCSSHGGTWTSGGSPLKYAVYDNGGATGTPLSKGKITSSDIGNDVTIYSGFTVNNTQRYYYIFIWLDGYLTDNTHTNLPFNGQINAEVIQAGAPSEQIVYTANIYDENATGYNSIWIGSTIPNTITTYNTDAEAMAALKTAGGGTTDYPFFLRHKIGDGTIWCATNGTNKYCIYESQAECTGEATSDFGSGYTCQSQNYTEGVSESYVGFVVTPAMALANSGMTAGTYYLKGGDNGRAYNDNIAVLKSAFGENTSYCTQDSFHFYCSVSGLFVYADSSGDVSADDGASSYCGVD